MPVTDFTRPISSAAKLGVDSAKAISNPKAILARITNSKNPRSQTIVQSFAEIDSPAAAQGRAPCIDSRTTISDPVRRALQIVPQSQALVIAPVRDQLPPSGVIARLPCDSQGVRRGMAVAMLFAGDEAIGDAASDKLAIVVEEWLINVLEHGGAAAGSRIVLRLQRLDLAIRVTITDAGCVFDPRDVTFEGPNPERGGGAGLALIKAWSRIVAYARRGGRNRLVLEMPLSAAAPSEWPATRPRP